MPPLHFFRRGATIFRVTAGCRPSPAVVGHRESKQSLIEMRCPSPSPLLYMSLALLFPRGLRMARAERRTGGSVGCTSLTRLLFGGGQCPPRQPTLCVFCCSFSSKSTLFTNALFVALWLLLNAPSLSPSRRSYVSAHAALTSNLTLPLQPPSSSPSPRSSPFSPPPPRFP